MLIDFGDIFGDQIKLFCPQSRSIIFVNQEPVLETPRFELATLDFRLNALKNWQVVLQQLSFKSIKGRVEANGKTQERMTSWKELKLQSSLINSCTYCSFESIKGRIVTSKLGNLLVELGIKRSIFSECVSWCTLVE